MTTHARTANEQRIASLEDEVKRLRAIGSDDAAALASELVNTRHELEAEVATLRGVLEALVEIERRDQLCDPVQTASDQWREQVWNNTRSALSSADHSGKVVVDREEWEALATLESVVWPDHSSDCICEVCCVLASLDYIRQGGSS